MEVFFFDLYFFFLYHFDGLRGRGRIIGQDVLCRANHHIYMTVPDDGKYDYNTGRTLKTRSRLFPFLPALGWGIVTSKS